MRRSTIVLVVAGLLLVVAAAGVAVAARDEGPVTVNVGELEVTADGSFRPTVGPKDRQTPIAVKTSGSFRMRDGSHPPAIREFVIEADKNGELHTGGIPACRPSQLQATETAAALKACGRSLIGEGTATAEVAFAEQAPIDVSSKLLLFNGGEKGNVTTWLAHVYFTNPVSSAFVAPVRITKIHRGRFGTRVVVKIPQLVGGAGSGTSFSVQIFKNVEVGGRTYNPISGRCPDGKIKLDIKGRFEDGTRAGAEIIRGCTGT